MALVNNGNENCSILEGYSVDDGTLTGFIMPNIPTISPDAIVPDGTAITYNQTSDVAPTGGANGDIWYNEPSDTLYKRIAGAWTLLTNRIINTFYTSPVQNLTDCPLPAPSPTNHFKLKASYNVEIVSVVNGTATGIPAAFGTANLPSGSTMDAAYTTVTAGTIQVTISGVPAIPGHTRLYLNVAGVEVATINLVSGQTLYSLVLGTTQNDPTLLEIGVETF